MSILRVLIHTCTIERQTHTKTASRKDAGVTTVATGVACRWQEGGDTLLDSIYGRSAQEAMVGWFKGDQDIEINDIVTWNSITMTITGKSVSYGRDGSVPAHIEVTAQKTSRVTA